MTAARQHFAIGLFTLLALALLAVGCVLFGGGSLTSHEVLFETYYNSSVQGLDIGSPVKLRGVQIGTVRAIGFAGTRYADRPEVATTPQDKFHPLTYVRVVGAIDLDRHPDYDSDRLVAMVARGLRANLALQGITGQLFVNLDFPRNGAPRPEPLPYPWTPDNLYIPSTPTTLQSMIAVVQNIADSLPQAVDTLNALAKNVDAVIQRANIPKLTASFTALGDSLNRQTQTLSDALESIDLKRLSQHLQTLADNLAETSGTIRKELPHLSKDLGETLAQTQALLRQASESLTTIRADVSARVPSVARDLDETLAALARTAAATEALVQELRQKPSRLIFDSPLDE